MNVNAWLVHLWVGPVPVFRFGGHWAVAVDIPGLR